jgi:predicted AAA+ superfamily ATPase
MHLLLVKSVNISYYSQMKRDLMSQLRAWKANPGRKPLILKGVRQTGKTYLLEQFGRENFPRYHLVNFEKQVKARALFEGDLEPKRLVDELRFLLGTSIDIKTDLIIFDEIQACPKALTSLKYFCEDLPELALCSAGSLLGLHLNESSYPAGKVDMLHLHPLKFSEFLAGMKDDALLNYLNNIQADSTPSDLAHQQLWQRLKEYFITGGLPEVVSVFSQQQNSSFEAAHAVRIKQNELINAYYADIAKHSGKVNAMHIDRTWRAIPTQLASAEDRSTQRFKFKGIIPNVNRYGQLVNVIDWLKAAELILKVSVSETAQQPLLAYTKENIFKLFMFDVGLLGAMSGLDPKTILDYDYGTYKGYFAENFVAQQLIASGVNELVSWENDRSEIEFLIQQEGKLFPIEVKSGNITRAKSLQKYIEKYQPSKSLILSANNLTIDHQNRIYRLPLYLAERACHFNYWLADL